MRAAWLVLAASASLALLASIPAYIHLTGVITDQEHFGAEVIGAPELFSPSPRFELWVDAGYHALSFGASALSLGLAALIIRRRPHEPVAYLVSLTLLGYAVLMAGPLEMLLGQSRAGQPVAYFAQSLLWGLVLFLFFIFPDGCFVPGWTRWASLLLIPWTFGLAVMASSMSPASDLTVLLVFYSLPSLAAPFAQIVRYRRAPSLIQRQQIKWAVFGLTAWVLAGSVVSGSFVLMARQWASSAGAVATPESSLLVFVGRMIWPVSLTFVPATLTVAILRYRLWNIDVLLSRTLVYGSLTVIIVGLYVVTVAGLSELFQSSGSFALSLFATGLIAMLFQPLRERLQYGVNRLLYGERDDPYGVLSWLGRRLEGTLAPEAVLPAVVETIAQTLKLPYVAVALYSAGATEPQVAAAHGMLVPTAARWPLTYQSERVGELLIAPRGPGETFTPAEQRLLSDIARQAGVAAHAVRLTTELQRSRQRLVATREEERRRLRRDLHDGLGPALASQTLTLTAARQLLRDDPAQAEALLAEAIHHAQAAITDIRRVVYELRPPALDDLGLAGALRALAAEYGTSGVQFGVFLPETLPPLPAAVEVACYRIAQEALTNVVKHAQAAHCTITVTINDALTLEVTDDGRGLPPDRRAGVGLASMRERTAELGGNCRVEPNPTGGTHVVAILPLG